MAYTCTRPSWSNWENDECACVILDDYSDVIPDWGEYCCGNCVYYRDLDE